MKYWLGLSLLFCLLSCNNQEVESIQSNNQLVKEELSRSQFCQQVDFVKNTLEHGNFRNLFLCVGWDSTFPALYQALANINPRKWNHLFGTLNEKIFSNIDIKNRVFSYFNDLDKNQGLEDLSLLLKHFWTPEITQEFAKLFQDPARKDNLLSSLKLLVPKQVTTTATQSLTSTFASILKTEKEAIWEISDQLLASEQFHQDRLSFSKDYLNSFHSAELPFAQKFYPVLFSGSYQESGSLYEWLQSKVRSEEEWLQLILFTYKDSPFFLDKLTLFYEYLQAPLICQDGDVGRNQVELDLRFHTTQFLTDLIDKERDELMQLLLTHSNNLYMVTKFCPNLRYLKNDRPLPLEVTDLLTHFQDVASLVQHPQIWSLTQLFFKITQTMNLDLLYPIRVILSDSFKSFDRVLRTIADLDPTFHRILYRILKKLTVRDHKTIAALIGRLLRVNQQDALKSLATIWSSISEQNQLHLLTLVDLFIQSGVDFDQLLTFISRLTKELDPFADLQEQNLVGSSSNLNKSYRSIQHIFTQLNAPGVIADLRKFLSREYILKTIELMTQGMQFSPIMDEVPEPIEFDPIPTPTSQSHPRPSIVFEPQKINHKDIVDCIHSFTKKEGTFYDYLWSRTPQCQSLDVPEVTFTFIGWLSNITNDFDKRYQPLKDKGRQHFLDDQSFLGPDMIELIVGLVKGVQHQMHHSFPAQFENTAGIEYFLSSLKHHLYELTRHKKDSKGYLSMFESIVKLASDFITGDDFRSFRNSLLAHMIKDHNTPSARTLLNTSSKLLAQLGQDLELNGLPKWSTFANTVPQKEQFRCERYLNTNIGGTPCPSTQRIETSLGRMLRKFTYRFDEKSPSLLDLLLDLLHPGRGISIASQSARRILTLEEVLTLTFDLTDRSLPVNQKVIQYRSEEAPKVKSPQRATTMERIEGVTRSVQFDRAYMGIHFLNAVTNNADFSKVVRRKKMLLKICSPIRFCSQKLGPEARRMAANALEFFDGLADANKEPLIYGNTLQAIITPFVKSSPPETQSDRLPTRVSWPLMNHLSSLHNITVFNEIVDLAMISNLGRWINDRISTNRNEFLSFVKDKAFQMVNKNLIRNLSLTTIKPLLEKVIQDLDQVKSEEGKYLYSILIEKINQLDYQELRLLEDLMGNALTVFSFLGAADSIQLPEGMNNSYKRDSLFHLSNRLYRENSLELLIVVAKELLPHWPQLYKEFQKGTFNWRELGLSLNRTLQVMKQELLSEGPFWQTNSYQALNTIWAFAKRLLTYTEGSQSLLKHFSKRLTDSQTLLPTTVEALEELTDYFLRLQYDLENSKMTRPGRRLKELGSNMSRLTSTYETDFIALKEYLLRTTQRCLPAEEATRTCQENYHYDELSRIFDYLQIESEGETHLDLAMKAILYEEYDQLVDLFQRIIGGIRVLPPKEQITP